MDMEDVPLVQTEDEFPSHDWFDSFTTDIFNTKYSKTDMKDVAKKQTHLSPEHKMALFELLQKHSKSLVENEEVIHIKRSTFILIQRQLQSILVLTQYHITYT